MIAVNVGSGQRRFTSTPEIEWVNVDVQSAPGREPDLVADGAALPYDAGSVDMVVLHHTLEHQTCGGGGLLEEAHRVLRLGGSLIITIPDIRVLAQRWLAGMIDDYIFFVNCMGAYMGDEADCHRWHYSFDSLRATLRNVGQWRSVQPFDWRVIPGADIARSWWIMGVEAIR